jgi:uncharacterized protein YdiU (UPF0061 family)
MYSKHTLFIATVLSAVLLFYILRTSLWLSVFYMLSRTLAQSQLPTIRRLSSMAQHLSNGANGAHANGVNGTYKGTTLADLPKSNVFTSNLPADQRFPTPHDSYTAPKPALGPAQVKGALYTYVKPEPKEGPILMGVSERAMKDIGLQAGEEDTTDFKNLVSGNKIMWEPDTKDGIYPWAQCYGGYQFGQWAGQLGDGRAISLFESTNPETKTRYEVQLKGAGKTPYSRFADGRAVVRSSVREFVVSEHLNALGIPTTRALSLTVTPDTQVRRERIEPGAIVCRFAQSWLRIGTFDLMRARGDRKLIRKTADYLAEHVFGGWDKITSTQLVEKEDGPSNATTIESPIHQNRYLNLYQHICRLNARTVAHWQAYGFTNGVLNTDNTSLMGLSLDFGPFAFIDNFDPSYTPNHDDHMLRYAYRNQPSIIWWNLVRLGESFGELIGAGPKVDSEEFVNEGVSKDFAPELIARAERLIQATGEAYQQEFLDEYKRLMTKRLGLKTTKEDDFKELYSELLDTLEALELDFSHFFRRLGGVTLEDMSSDDARKHTAGRFFHHEGITGLNVTEDAARERLGAWLDRYRARVVEDWSDGTDKDRAEAMRKVNPKFVARGWVLDELIKKVQDEGDKETLARAMKMALNPFEEHWDPEFREEEERWCGDVPRAGRGIMCSCSS